MNEVSKESLEKMENRILGRLEPKDKIYVMSLIRNVIISIKRIQGEALSKEETSYPPHPLFSHADQKGGQSTVETLLYRLRLIDRYHFDKREYIVETLTRNLPIIAEKKFTARKAQILWHIYQEPTTPKYQLAKKVGVTPRTVTRDLAELERDYSFRIFTSVDPYKFHLIPKILVFETKSISHTKELENHLREHNGFLRAFRLDQDMRRGTITYRYPDQLEGHRIFENHIQWLNDEFFYSCDLIRPLGLHQFISFEMYDPTTHAYSIEAEIVSQVPFDYNKDRLNSLPQPLGFNFTHAFWFDQADFLLADTLYSSGPFSHPEYKRRRLKQHGINYSMKTIWKKEQRLRREKAGHPTIDLQIPGFDEDLALVVFCTSKTASLIRAISTFLPYVMVVNTDSGCLLRIQRPVHTSALTAQLIRKIHRQRGVENVKLLRYQRTLRPPLITALVNRWNTAEQKWDIQEGDL
jgi:hypothetical protein